jgi:transposase
VDRAAKVAKARKLREQGLSYAEISEQLGISYSTAYDYVTEATTRWRREHPDRLREQNLARNDAKREAEAGECERCGGRVSDGKRFDRCNECRRTEERSDTAERAERFIRLRERGLLNHQIAELEGVSMQAVATVLYRAHRQIGLYVPPSPYHHPKPPILG